MDSKEINRYPIVDYLRGLGITPDKEYAYYGMYHSPFREDKTPSFKVDYDKNLWIDFGTGENGSIIDLVMKMENCTNGRAMQLLEQHIPGNHSFSFQRESVPTYRKEAEPAIQINDVRDISHPALIQYLNERNIYPDLANQYCREVYYSIKNRDYFAIGFQNDSRGWVLRNKSFKACTSMDVKTYSNSEPSKDTCLVFEGFADFLSYLTMKGEKEPKHDVVVLNSIVNLSKVINELSAYKSVQAFFDNDEGGKRAVLSLRSVCKEVVDQSVHYANHKDLNDYLCSRFMPKQAVKKTPGRGLKM
jgi:DNA primase (bacterial type)